MSPFRIHSIENMSGKQVILWLKDEHGRTESPDDLSYCVRLPVDEAPQVIADLVEAYASVMQEAMIDIAAGGCRTCGNRRRIAVDGGRWSALFHGGEFKPCPVCVPRAEKRIRASLFLPRRHRPQPKPPDPESSDRTTTSNASTSTQELSA